MTTLAEPEWDDATRELALGFEEMDRCPICQGPANLCQDPDREFDWQASAVRCHRTTALRTAQAQITEETNPHADALAWATNLREGAV